VINDAGLNAPGVRGHEVLPIPSDTKPPPNTNNSAIESFEPNEEITISNSSEGTQRIKTLEHECDRLQRLRESLIDDYRTANSELISITSVALKSAQATPPSYVLKHAEICIVNGFIICEITRVADSVIEVMSLADDYSEYSTDRTTITILPRHLQRDIRTLRRDKVRIQKLLDGISRELAPILCRISDFKEEYRALFHKMDVDGSIDLDSEIQRIRIEMDNMMMQRKSIEERRRYYKRLLLLYHPDKRQKDSGALDDEIFKYIQSTKEWFCQVIG